MSAAGVAGRSSVGEGGDHLGQVVVDQERGVPRGDVFEALGVGDVVSKSLGTSNPYNMVRATFDALKNQQSPRMVAQRRGRSVAEILARREDQMVEA